MFGVDSNIMAFDAKMNELIKNIENAVNEAMFQIRDDTVTEVTDNKNWNPRAVYKRGKLKGQRYDLELTGQLIKAIRNPEFNTITKSGSTWTLGIGNTEELDKLKSPKAGSNPDTRYWRLVVFGREPIVGWTFLQTGDDPSTGKPIGKAVKQSDPSKRIEGSHPTHMFERGLRKAKRKFPRIIKKSMKTWGVGK